MEENQLAVIKSRYLWEEKGENWEAACHRVASTLMAKEPQYIEPMAEVLFNLEFLFGGRILRNAGRPKGNLINCAGLELPDDTHGIGMFLHDALMLWKKGAGVGTYVDLRPKGAPLMTDGGYSSGAVSFLHGINGIAEVIEVGGQRRAAILGIMPVSHPEIVDYIEAKLVHGKLNCFNLSVAITNEFLDAVERNNSWEFRFANKSYGSVKARELWEKILECMVRCGEPGLVNWDNFTKNNSYYCAPICCANACAEQPLEKYGSCDLGSLNLVSFLTAGGQWKRSRMEEVVRLAVRGLDNVLDITYYPLPQMEKVAQKIRRIGLGTMGLADYLFGKEIRYGSEDALNEVEKVYKFIRNVAYEESVKIAQEKGAFPAFDATAFGRASFVRKLPHSLRMDIKSKGIRNIALLSGPPTGTTSQVANVSSGIEPLFAKAYRNTNNVVKDGRIFVHPQYVAFLQNPKFKMPDWFVDAHDITPAEHLDMLLGVAKHVDSSVSKTCNLPEGTTVKQLSKVLMEYAWDFKSVTVYVDKSRPVQVYYPLTHKEVMEHLKAKGKIDWGQVQTCKDGVCEL